MKPLQLLKKKDYKKCLVLETKRYTPEGIGGNIFDGVSTLLETISGISNYINQRDARGLGVGGSRILATHILGQPREPEGPSIPPVQIARNRVSRVPLMELLNRNEINLQNAVYSELNRRVFLIDGSTGRAVPAFNDQIVGYDAVENVSENVVIVQPERRDYRIFEVVLSLEEARNAVSRGRIPMMIEQLVQPDPMHPTLRVPLPRLAINTVFSLHEVMSAAGISGLPDPTRSREELITYFDTHANPANLSRIYGSSPGEPVYQMPALISEDMFGRMREDFANGSFYNISQVQDGILTFSRGLNLMFSQEEIAPRNFERFENFNQLSVADQVDVLRQTVAVNPHSSLSRIILFLRGSVDEMTNLLARPGTPAFFEIHEILSNSRDAIIEEFAMFLATPDASFYFTESQRIFLLQAGGFARGLSEPQLINAISTNGNNLIMPPSIYNYRMYGANAFAESVNRRGDHEIFDAFERHHFRTNYIFYNMEQNLGDAVKVYEELEGIKKLQSRYHSPLTKKAVPMIAAWNTIRDRAMYFAYMGTPAMHAGTHLYSLMFRIILSRKVNNVDTMTKIWAPHSSDLAQNIVDKFGTDETSAVGEQNDATVLTEENNVVAENTNVLTEENAVVAENTNVLEANTGVEQNVTTIDQDTAISTLNFFSDFFGSTTLVGSIIAGIVTGIFFYKYSKADTEDPFGPY